MKDKSDKKKSNKNKPMTQNKRQMKTHKSVQETSQEYNEKPKLTCKMSKTYKHSKSFNPVIVKSTVWHHKLSKKNKKNNNNKQREIHNNN